LHPTTVLELLLTRGLLKVEPENKQLTIISNALQDNDVASDSVQLLEISADLVFRGQMQLFRHDYGMYKSGDSLHNLNRMLSSGLASQTTGFGDVGCVSVLFPHSLSSSTID
jgi:hypothetical protein